MINPALRDSPREMKLIGMMVVGYTDLELTFAHVAGLVLGLKWEVLHALEKIYSETGKIKVIHALSKGAFDKAKLGEEYHIAKEMIGYCAVLRNQYAHAHYARNYAKKQLEFVDSDDVFKTAKPFDSSMLVPIKLKLLREQAAYFEGTRAWLLYLELTLEGRGKRNATVWTKPPRMPQPPKNSSPPPRPHVRGKRVPASKRQAPDPKGPE